MKDCSEVFIGREGERHTDKTRQVKDFTTIKYKKTEVWKKKNKVGAKLGKRNQNPKKKKRKEKTKPQANKKPEQPLFFQRNINVILKNFICDTVATDVLEPLTNTRLVISFWSLALLWQVHFVSC